MSTGELAAAFLAAGCTADGDDPDAWTLTEDTPGMRDAIVTTLRFDADAAVLRAETNSDERAARVVDLVDAAVSSARLLDDQRRDLDEFVRAKEVEWLDQQIPALGGRTPREAVADPVGRDDVRRLLASFPELPPGEVGCFRASRPRTHLGLDG